MAGCAERREVCHHQRALQRGDEQGELPGDQEQVSGPKVQGETSVLSNHKVFMLSRVTPHWVFLFRFFPKVTGAGVGDRGAAAQGGLPEYDGGPGSPLHGPQHSLQ